MMYVHTSIGFTLANCKYRQCGECDYIVTSNVKFFCWTRLVTIASNDFTILGKL